MPTFADVSATVRSRARGLTGPTMMAMSERLVNRGTSAVVTFGMALFVSPAAAGAYAFGMLALTFAQALGQGVLLQVGVSLWRYEHGGAQLTRIARAIALGGGVIVALALLGGKLGGLYDWTALLQLLPLAVIAVVDAWFVPAITLAQYRGEWARLTRTQTIGSVLSLAVALPLLPWAGILGAVLQSVVAETFFSVRAGRRADPPQPDRPAVDVLRRFVVPTAVTNLFGWTNGQANRLVVTVLAGAGPLGLLSIALAVSKTATDAVLSGTLNLLRFRLASAQTEEERRAAFSGMLLRSSMIAAALQVAVSLLSVWPLRWVLAAEWRPALAVVPLLAMSGVLMAVHYSVAAAVIEGGRASRLRAVNITSFVLSVTVGVVLSVSLPIGSIAQAVADLIALIVVYPLMRESVERRVHIRLVAIIAAAFVFGVAFYWAQGLIP